MYETYFGLAESPFRITPDPRYLWYSPQHQEAKQKILYHITHSVSPIYLLANIGTGKTTIARRIVDELMSNPKHNVVTVFAPKLRTANAFLRFVMAEFEVKTERSFGASLRNFETFLVEQHQAGNSPVLLVDEAQNMNREMLLLIQHLFNFSTHTEFLIQMALFTQPELQPKLNRLKSLQSRMNVARLKPFDLEQTRQMMQFRWTVAGGGELPFSEDAVEEVFRLTEGVPRQVVKLANEALMKTAVDNKRLVTRDIVLSALSEVQIENE